MSDQRHRHSNLSGFRAVVPPGTVSPGSSSPLRGGIKVRGLTTGITLWCPSMIGLLASRGRPERLASGLGRLATYRNGAAAWATTVVNSASTRGSLLRRLWPIIVAWSVIARPSVIGGRRSVIAWASRSRRAGSRVFLCRCVDRLPAIIQKLAARSIEGKPASAIRRWLIVLPINRQPREVAVEQGSRAAVANDGDIVVRRGL